MKSRDGKAISECGPTGAETPPLAFGSAVAAGATGACGVVVVPCSGAVHGGAGPAMTSVPFSYIVPPPRAPGLGRSHRTRDSEALTLATSVVLFKVYLAVQVMAVAESYVSVPSRGARRSRRPLKPNLSLLIRRCSSWASGI